MKSLKMMLVVVFCIGLVQLSFGQPDTLWTETIISNLNEEIVVAKTLNDGNLIIGNGNTIYIFNSDYKLLRKKSFEQISNSFIFDVEQLTSGSLILGGFNGKPYGGNFMAKYIPNPDSIYYFSVGAREIDVMTDDKFLVGFSVTPESYLHGYGLVDSVGNLIWQTSLFEGLFEIIKSVSPNKFLELRREEEVNILTMKFTDQEIDWTTIINDSSLGKMNSSILLLNNNNFKLIRANKDNQLYYCEFDVLGNIVTEKTILLKDLLNLGDELVTFYPAITHDDGLIVVGGTFNLFGGYTFICFKLNKDGDILWNYKNNAFTSHCGKFVKETEDQGYVIVTHNPKLGDIGMIRLETDTITVPVSNLKNSYENNPIDFNLSQNYPNPFNPSTTIEFTLPHSEYTTLKVYNILGAEVATLVANKLQAGQHSYQFDGSNLASGVYYYQVTAGEFRDVKKMILLR